ncbi:DotG/IcmE/VirB10 family protein [Shinella sumterensis]|jgi:intracellular multiplication protein IcmE|uniref:DotG/IcmE/VirB10 family protein n=1 Tax=Shinella sumterensis TaxID=1967501 RepID=A0AA50CSQ2_9HYPH|nr:DotG/IcmE/VirB10 family protein [Shinella sumterensis]WLS01366.1 DotG/IcmE/VirB10 family protein [Shinella sumterensis]
MSDENKENVTPEPEREDVAPGLDRSAEVNARPKKRGNMLQTVVVVGLLASAVGYVGYQTLKPGELDASRIARGPGNIDATPAGSELANSERYQQSLNTVNDDGAARAQQAGSSFIATPDEPLRNVDDVRDVTKDPVARRPIAPANVETTEQVDHVTPDRRRQQPDDYSDINILAERMGVQQAALMAQWSPRPSGLTMVVQQDLYKTPAQRQAEAEALLAKNANGADASAVGGDTLISAGQFVFARTVNASDSDTPGPVVVEIMKQGPLYRARLLGQFSQNKNTSALIVEFNRMVLADGREVAVSAYAVDSRRGSIALTSGVDKRWVERYGPRLAGAFIDGLGSTLGRVGQQVVVGDNSTTIVNTEASMKQALYAGAGRVGSELAGEIADSAPKGPLVKLDSGYTIGILFMESVQAPALSAASYSLKQ